jgi:hypothetical protein
MKKRVYKNIIKEEGEFFDRIYFIIKGNVQCLKNENNEIIENKYKENEYFGEVGLFIDFITNYNYKVNYKNGNEEVIVYELYNYQVPEILGKNYLNVIMENLFISTISNCVNLKNYFTTEGILALYKIFQLEFYFSNKIIYLKDQNLNKKICIIITGKLIKENDKNILIAKTEDIYGEEIIDKKEK